MSNSGVVQTIPDEEISKPLGDEAEKDSERLKLKPNEGNGCNLRTYKWTQTMETLEVRYSVESCSFVLHLFVDIFYFNILS